MAEFKLGDRVMFLGTEDVSPEYHIPPWLYPGVIGRVLEPNQADWPEGVTRVGFGPFGEAALENRFLRTEGDRPPPKRGEFLEAAKTTARAVRDQMTSQPGRYSLSMQATLNELHSLERYVQGLIRDVEDELGRVTSEYQEAYSNGNNPRRKTTRDC